MTLFLVKIRDNFTFISLYPVSHSIFRLKYFTSIYKFVTIDVT